MHALCVQETLEARLQDCDMHDQTSKAVARQHKAYSHVVLLGPSSSQT